MTNQDKNLAVLMDKPANPATNPITGPMMGIQQFMLLNAQEHLCIPLFLKRNSGNIQYYYLMKAMLPNMETNESQRMLQHCWLLIPANPQVSGENQKFYFGDRNHGMIHMHNKMLALGGNSAYNSLIAKVTLRNMPIVPNKAQLKWTDKIWPMLNEQHNLLCGTADSEPLMRKSDAFTKFMNDGNAKTHALFMALLKDKKIEANTVFEVMPDSIILGKTMFYGDNHTASILENQHNGINKPMCISSWNGVFRGDLNIATTTNGLGLKLEHGIRKIGEGTKQKYGVDIVGKVFDRLSNTTEGRLTCIDPVTIAYLNSGNAKDEDASEEVLNAIATTNRKSRAHVLHGAFEQNEHIQINDAELKLHANGDNPDSMKISWELRITDTSTYKGLRDISKLGSINASADDSFLDLLMSGNDISDKLQEAEADIDYEELLNQSNDLQKEVTKVEKKDEPVSSPSGMDIDSDLPF